ncbi:putative MFS-type transporter [Beauveria bassiana]|nr:putative MFS-type transporter [Beauveria bassiana]KAH8715344.1 putative MFS-type transporter [Beauveria bassiana]
MGIYERTQSPGNGPADHLPGTVKLLHRRNGGQVAQVTLLPRPTEDPNDPLNWSMWRKGFNFALLASMTLAIFTGIQSLFLGRMRNEMHITSSQFLIAKAILASGEAITCAIFMPFAKKYGRRLLYIVSTAVFTAAVWWSAYMETALELYLTDLLKGLAGAINETAVQMSIYDMFFVHQRGSANSIYFTALKLGYTLTPMAAGAQAQAYGWRSCYRTLGIVMAVLTILFAFGYEETKFVRPAGYEGDSVESLESGTMDKKTASERPAVQATFPHYLRLQLLTPTSESLWKAFYQPFFTVAIPQVLFTSLVYGFSLCVISITASMKAIILTAPPYNFNPQELGLMYIGPFIGTVFGALYGGILVDRGVVWLARRNRDIFEPEMRLYFLPISALAMAAGTIMFGVTADRGLHWAYPATGTGLASFGFGGIANIVFTLMIDSYPKKRY